MRKFLVIGFVMFAVLAFGSFSIAADTQSGNSKKGYDMKKKKPDSQPGKSGQQQSAGGKESGKKPYTMQEPKKD